MKKVFTLIFTFFSVVFIYAQEWEIQQQNPNVFLYDIQMLSENNTGYAVGADKTGDLRLAVILKTMDDGETWDLLDLPFSNSAFLRNLHFVNEDLGWVVGNDGAIFKTTDGGMNWSSQISGTSRVLQSVFFINETTGWAAGGDQDGNDSYLILKTIDGGATWQSLSFGSDNYRIRDVWFLNEQVGWICGLKTMTLDPHIYKTTDGGLTWTEQSHPLPDEFNDMRTIRFVNENEGWAVGTSLYTNGEVLHTTDGGTNWEIQFSTGFDYNRLAVQDENNIAVASAKTLGGSDARVFVSNNGGDSFNSYDLISNDNIGDIVFQNDKIYIVGRQSIIMKSENNGALSQIKNKAPRLQSIAWADESTGWITQGYVVGPPPTSLKTTDGGVTWETVAGAPGGSQVQFMNDQMGWILQEGTNAIIWKTTDGGNNWLATSPGGGGSYMGDMFFANETDGWVVGSNKKIRKTVDGGNTWFTQNITDVASNAAVGCVHVIDANIAFCGGGYGSGNGFIQKTINGGAMWANVNIPTDEHVREISFADSEVGFACTVGGATWKTVDGGDNWVEAGLVDHPYGEGIFAQDADTVFLIARDGTGFGATDTGRGYLYKSIDGGISWNLDYVNDWLKSDLTHFSIQNSNRQWLVGNHNLIVLKSSEAPLSINQPMKIALQVETFPNPFVESLQFQMSLQERMEVRLFIFDRSGKVVFMDKKRDLNSGDHTLDWNANELPAGVYHYYLETENSGVSGSVVKQ